MIIVHSLTSMAVSTIAAVLTSGIPPLPPLLPAPSPLPPLPPTPPSFSPPPPIPLPPGLEQTDGTAPPACEQTYKTDQEDPTRNADDESDGDVKVRVGVVKGLGPALLLPASLRPAAAPGKLPAPLAALWGFFLLSEARLQFSRGHTRAAMVATGVKGAPKRELVMNVHLVYS